MPTRPSDTPETLGHCHCGAEVRSDGFRDLASYLECRITGNCQACQDRMFLCTNAHDPSRPFALRHGVVAAHSADCDEAAALPFLFTVEEPRIAWEARFILRIGARLEPLDPYAALAPMAEALHGHAVRVRESTTVHDPALPVRLARTDLFIVLDHATRETLKRLPLPARHRVVVLADEPHWSAHYATSLPELERAWAAEPEPHRSALRACALLGWALARVPDGAPGAARPIHALFDDAHRGA